MICILVIAVCFEFRYSDFEFADWSRNTLSLANQNYWPNLFIRIAIMGGS